MATFRRSRPGDDLYNHVVRRMKQTLMDHNNDIPLADYKIIKVLEIYNPMLEERFERKKEKFERYQREEIEPWEAFHGSPVAKKIAHEGFDIDYSSAQNMFGRGIYIAPNSSKANQYTFDYDGCYKHQNIACQKCLRRMLLCRCLMGKMFFPSKQTTNIPRRFHSVVADPRQNDRIREVLRYPEYVLLENDQILPYAMVEYKISNFHRHDFSEGRLNMDGSIRQMMGSERYY